MTMTELTFPIFKREMFDEDNMKYLLNDKRFCKQDRNKLSKYNKHRVDGSKSNVSYKLGKGCEEHKLGRLFPDDGVGLQAFRFDLRNPLAKKWYWDIDVENCHYILALHQCRKYGIIHEKLLYYIEKREECLKMVSSSRKKAKTEFLKTLYLGNIHLYNESWNEVEGNITEEGHIFIKELQKEVEALATMMWDEYKIYHKLKIGQDNKAIEKKPNPKASLMSIMFQTYERDILLTLDKFLTANGRYMGVYIHDGGYVEKLEGETCFPAELLEQGKKYIIDAFGYDKIKITQKAIEYEWTPYKPQETQYDVMKREFEERNFLVGADFCCLHTDGFMQNLRKNDAFTKFQYMKVGVYDEEKEKTIYKPFLNMWLEDPERREYERMDFIPNLDACPDTIYNLFKGFNAEQYRPEIEMTQELIETAIQPVIKHFDYLTSGNSEFLCKWFANIIQSPNSKSGVSPLIRDMNSILVEGGGTGKNMIIEWFGNEILGEQYIQVVSNNGELYGSFNSMYEGKLLIFVEEASGKDNHSNNDYLKAKITAKKLNVNKKNVSQYTVNDYARYLFTSNNRNPMKDNRRFAIFDTNPVMRGNVAYFEDLATELAKPEVKWAFYSYLKTLKTYQNPIQFQHNVPITPAYREIKLLNAPLYHKWLISLLKSGKLVDGDTVSELYRKFTEWVGANRERCSFIISMTEFGLLLNSKELNEDWNLQDVGNKQKKGGVMTMKWNVDALVTGLIKLHILEPDFEYTDDIRGECQIDDEDICEETKSMS